MLEFDTPFHARVRNLKSPTSSAYDPAAWATALAEANDGTESDFGLALGATWLAAESDALRRVRKDPEFEALDAGVAVTLAVAAINRDYLTIADLHNEMLQEAQNQGAISLGHMAARSLRIGASGQSASAEAAVEASVDAAESWLFDAYLKANGAAEIANDLAPVAARVMRWYSIQHLLNDLWNQGVCHFAASVCEVRGGIAFTDRGGLLPREGEYITAFVGGGHRLTTHVGRQ